MSLSLLRYGGDGIGKGREQMTDEKEAEGKGRIRERGISLPKLKSGYDSDISLFSIIVCVCVFDEIYIYIL